jgi:hypothetical protein
LSPTFVGFHVDVDGEQPQPLEEEEEEDENLLESSSDTLRERLSHAESDGQFGLTNTKIIRRETVDIVELDRLCH